jgi:hypothetical protein
VTTDQAAEPTPQPVPATWDELDAWLDSIPPIPRALLLGVMVDARNIPKLAAKRKAAVAEASNGYGTAAEVAAQLGVSVRRVYKTVAEHRATRDSPAS